MNLEKMLKTQKNLDNRIIKEKGLDGRDLFPNTILALNVELAEFANEGRWFKHWSNDQEPRTSDKCTTCLGTGEIYGTIEEGSDPCWQCEGDGLEGDGNPLLEEYVDALHFFLSSAIQKGWEEHLYLHEEAIEDLRNGGFQGGLTGAFNEMQYLLLRSYMERQPNKEIEKTFGMTVQEFHFRSAWFLFICIGLIGFEFTLEQIEEAYFEKNKVNHERQKNGY